MSEDQKNDTRTSDARAEAEAFRNRHIMCSQGVTSDGLHAIYKHDSKCEHPDENVGPRVPRKAGIPCPLVPASPITFDDEQRTNDALAKVPSETKDVLAANEMLRAARLSPVDHRMLRDRIAARLAETRAFYREARVDKAPVIPPGFRAAVAYLDDRIARLMKLSDYPDKVARAIARGRADECRDLKLQLIQTILVDEPRPDYPRAIEMVEELVHVLRFTHPTEHPVMHAAWAKGTEFLAKVKR